MAYIHPKAFIHSGLNLLGLSATVTKQLKADLRAKQLENDRLKAENNRLKIKCKLECFDDTSIAEAVELFVEDPKLAENKYGAIGTWPTCKVTHLIGATYFRINDDYSDDGEWRYYDDDDFKLFASKRMFNGDISDWDISSVTSLHYTFYDASSFNRDLSDWDVSSCTIFSYTFYDASSFNGDISSWDVTSAKTLYATFENAKDFKGDVCAWDISSIDSLLSTFQYATSFNGDILPWDVSSVTTLRNTFNRAYAFNIDISAWDISSVYNFGRTFLDTRSFNQCLEWTLKKGANTRYMFDGSLGRLGPCDLSV